MNSYAVYIIHLPVIGMIALLFLDVNVAAMMKYLLVTLLAFFVSNLLVTAYRKTVQPFFSNKIFRIAVPIAFILLTIAIYVFQARAEATLDSEPAFHTVIVTPKMDLHSAVMEGNFEEVRKHIQAGTNIDIKEPSGGSSPLILAALLGKTEIAIVLIEAGADVDLTNNEGSTSLHTAAFFCSPEIVEALLANGADTSIRNNSGATAFETVSAPFESVKGIYDYFGNSLGPIGLELDYKYIETTRPIIAEMLR